MSRLRRLAAATALLPALVVWHVARRPRDAYVTINDLPKLAELRRRFPDLYQQ